MQHDFFTAPAGVQRDFKDIRNTRPTVAEEKATLLLELGSLMRSVPAKVANGSVNLTRRWVDVHKKAAKVAGSSRSSVMEIKTAINDMKAHL